MNQKSSSENSLASAPLGKKSAYSDRYDPSLLFPVPRQLKRAEIGVSEPLPFTGCDRWTAFEMSWLNPKGKPIVALGEFEIPCDSSHLIESKSFKLYLNSFNNTVFPDFEQVRTTLERDLSRNAGAPVSARLSTLGGAPGAFGELGGVCLDGLDIECTDYLPNPEALSASGEVVEETLHTHLLKSNCLITGQPDWGSIEVRYRGRRIDPAGLLKYVVSLRNHNEFHEQCVERIFVDIVRRCSPEKLSVYARYTRRGGLDINPFRTSFGPGDRPKDVRLIRQ